MAVVFVAAAPSAPRRFAYDQVEIQLFGGSGPIVDSGPSTFERDYRWASTATGDADHRYATLHHVAYWDDWVRVETAQSIQLANPTLRRIIIATKHDKTYRVYDGAEADAFFNGTRTAYVGTTGIVFSGAPGRGIFTETKIRRHLPSIAIEGRPVIGQSIISVVKESDATGLCKSDLYSAPSTTDETVYRALFDEPATPPFHVPMMRSHTTSACTPTRVPARSSDADRAFDGLFLMFDRQESGTLIDITERGHIRTLRDADRQMFDVPAGYAKAE